ncbi:hypothetical protein PPACK8108_LOCUS11227 [Phakopsora pachyrhizi]|uniref:Uncharacterized protein n=1 Tax=Phakopsora pachyrhizi TaxID=170000 RepID=A0AAV0B2L4_PHAPC|nr:hypothetical protein PPACK8108_LOCUS11227 [Phakopsora pachyrhizi]
MGVVLGEEGRGRERKSWACHLSPPASLPGLRKTIRKRGRPGSPSPSSLPPPDYSRWAMGNFPAHLATVNSLPAQNPTKRL